jgi:PAS domain S-box-containing protein
MTTGRSSSAKRLRGYDDARVFQRLVESLRDYAIFMLDPRGHVATWNVGAERMKQYRADEILGQHFSVFYPARDLAKCAFELEEAARNGSFEDEGWRVRKDESRFWANVVITAIRGDDGALLGYSKVTRDLTDRRRAEEEHRARLAADERFRLLIESVRDYAIFMLDPTGHIATWNIGAERIKGYVASEIIGKHFSIFYPAADVSAGKCERELAGASADGRFEDEGIRVRKDGSTFWANVVISAVRDREGTLIGFSKVTRDLTERKRNEDDRASRLAAEQATRAKDEFLATLGHELRNPLAPILTALELMRLRGGRISSEQEVIERQAQHLTRLVDDLLDISKIGRGAVALTKRWTPIRTIISKAVEVASPLFEQRFHRLEFDVPEGDGAFFGDEMRLVQVFANLLVNAAKYTDPNGRISVRVTTRDDWLDVTIADDGRGIEPALLPHIFDLFVQGEQGVERAKGGLGIGLSLVRSLVELHGGTVEARSDGPGTGSTFTVRLPREGARLDVGPEPTEEPATRKRALRVLLVDDNADALVLLAEVLRAVGHDVVTAADPTEALRVAPEFRPEVAVLDIGLPIMDGYVLGARLREALAPANIRLISLSGYGQPRDRERSLGAGFDLHLVKPVSSADLIASLAGDRA